MICIKAIKEVIPMEETKCLKCGWSWVKRTKGRPAACPQCKSRSWDKERKNKTKKEAQVDGNNKAKL